MTTIHISAKCSDAFSAFLRQDDKIIGEYDGYVPAWFPNPKADNDSDYVILEIDIATGKIVNWKKPNAKQIKETFKTSLTPEKTTAQVAEPLVKFVTDKGYTYQTNKRIRVGSIVEVPTVDFLRDVFGDTNEVVVKQIGSNYDGWCKEAIAVKKY